MVGGLESEPHSTCHTYTESHTWAHTHTHSHRLGDSPGGRPQPPWQWWAPHSALQDTRDYPSVQRQSQNVNPQPSLLLYCKSWFYSQSLLLLILPHYFIHYFSPPKTIPTSPAQSSLSSGFNLDLFSPHNFWSLVFNSKATRPHPHSLLSILPHCRPSPHYLPRIDLLIPKKTKHQSACHNHSAGGGSAERQAQLLYADVQTDRTLFGWTCAGCDLFLYEGLLTAQLIPLC